MDFRVTGLSLEPFRHLYGLTDEELARQGVHRIVVDASPGYPDRIEMRDGKVGERFLLRNHICHDAATPYRATHAIYVREGATEAYDRVNQIPKAMRLRLLSLRAFNAAGMMVDADVAEGDGIEPVIHRFLADPTVDHIDVHNAKPGCFSGRVTRA